MLRILGKYLITINVSFCGLVEKLRLAVELFDLSVMLRQLDFGIIKCYSDYE